MTNITTPTYDQDRNAPEGFRALRALLARQAGAEHLGLSLWELPAGEAAYPYHFHLADEELIVVLVVLCQVLRIGPKFHRTRFQ